MLTDRQNIAPINTVKNKTIQLIATDFDLTIFDYAEPQATKLLLPWFEKLHAMGVKTGIASGRTIAELRGEFDAIDIPWAAPFPDYVICEEGQICTVEGKDWPGAKEWNRRRAQTMLQANEMIRPAFEELVRWAASQGIPIIRPIMSGLGGVNVVFETPEYAMRALEILRDRLGRESSWVMSRNHHIVLAMPRGLDKGDALSHLARIEGISASNVLALGDNLNDRGMLCNGHGFSVATVANAIEEIRNGVSSQGGFIAQSRVARGVAEILAHHFS